MSSGRKVALGVLLVIGLVAAYVSRTTGNGADTASGPSPSSTRPTTAVLPGPGTGEPGPNSADRVVFWAKAADCVAMTDAQLDAAQAMGIDGYICWNLALSGATNAGEQAAEWSGNPATDISGPRYDLQRRLTASPLVRRAKAGQVKVYLGFYTINYNNKQTHLSEWFDDRGWSGNTIPKVSDLAGAAKAMGFAGVALDLENYPQSGSWNWNYAGSTRPEAEVRAKARDRGAQLMGAILAAFPDVDLLVYGAKFPGTWDSVVQDSYHAPGFDNYVQPEFWDGMSSVDGYRAIRFTGELFYKSWYPAKTWDDALRYASGSFQAFLSRTWQNWDYASSRVFLSPAAWIDAGDNRTAMPPDYVSRQLDMFRTWGDGGEFYVFAFQSIAGFDYAPYADGIRQASTPATVDTEAPRVRIVDAPSSVSADTVDVSGTASDNIAVRRVTWSDDRGGGGAAQMTWEAPDGPTNWSVDGLALRSGINTITFTVEDIKGLTGTDTLLIESRSGTP